MDGIYEKELVGGASYDANGDPLTSEVLEKAKQSDAILLGAVRRDGLFGTDVRRLSAPDAQGSAGGAGGPRPGEARESRRGLRYDTTHRRSGRAEIGRAHV